MKNVARICYFLYAAVINFSLCYIHLTSAGPVNIVFDKQYKYLDGGSIEPVSFYAKENEEATKLILRQGLLFKQPHARATIVVCHGFMCDKFDIGFIRRMLFPSYNVLMFDFRAHGEHIDPSHCCTFGRDEAYDVLGAVSYIKSREDIGSLPLIAYGFSMGAVAAIQAQSLHCQSCKKDPSHPLFNAMILDCPYDSSENVIKKGLENLKITLFGYTFYLPGRYLLQKYAFNPYVQTLLKALLKTISHMDATATNTYIYPLTPAESIKNISIPCFFIHCRNDEKVSVQAVKNVYEHAAGYKRLWVTEGRRHFDSLFYYPEKYHYKVERFIDDVLNDRLAAKEQQKIIYDIL